jgi:hypothetical protein
MRIINTYYTTQILQTFTSGANEPILAKGINMAGDHEEMVIKLMDGHRMDPQAAARELTASLMAEELSINTPVPMLADITNQSADLANGTYNYSRLNNSKGLNFATSYLLDIDIWTKNSILSQDMYDEALKVFHFDMLIQNPDRTFEKGKPNLFTIGKELYVIDHELAFSFTRPLIGRAPTHPYEFSAYDVDMIQNHVLYKHLSKKSLNYTVLDQSLDRLNSDFWTSVRTNLPQTWVTNELAMIENHIEAVRQNHSTFVSNIKNLLS